MNTNLNNIPLEIYLDYISEYTQQEWNLQTLTATSLICGHEYDPVWGCGNFYEYGNIYGYGYMHSYGFGHSYKYGNNFGNGYHNFGNGYGTNHDEYESWTYPY